MFRKGEAAARKIGKSHTTLTGKIPSTKDEMFKAFESPLERDFLVILDFNWSVESFHPQPVSINYADAMGTLRKYTPDVLVHFRKDRLSFARKKSLLVEIKSERDLAKNHKLYEMRFKAAYAYAAQRNWEFRILTERDIRTPYLKNANFLRQFRFRQIDGYLRSALEDAANSSPEGTPELFLARAAELIAIDPNNLQYRDVDFGEVRAALIPELWRLVDDCVMSVDLHKPLTMNCLMWRRKSHEEVIHMPL